MIETLLLTLCFAFLVMFILLPLVAWAERKQVLPQGRVGPKGVEILGVTLFGLLQPLADALEMFAREDVAPRGAGRALWGVAPIIAIVAGALPLAVIPFGARYHFGDHELSLVVADPDWGVLYLLAVGCLAALGVLLAGDSSDDPRGAARVASQMLSCQVALGLSWLGLLMAAGSLSLSEVAAFQDTSFRVFGFVEHLGLAPAAPDWLGWVRLPLWGVLVQPLGFGLSVVCLLARSRRPPFGAAEDDATLIAAYTGPRLGMFRAAELLELLVVAMLLATLFFGGSAIPFVSQESFVRFVARAFGEGFATGLCLLVHVACFLAKTLALVWLQLRLRSALPRLRSAAVMKLCWRSVLPLALVNVFATGAVLLLLDRSS